MASFILVIKNLQDELQKSRWCSTFENWSKHTHTHLLVLRLVVDQCEAASAAIMTVKMVGHEDTGTALLIFAFSSETGDFAIVVHFVEFQNGQLDLLVLMLVLLGGGVILLLALLGATTKSEDKMKGGLFLDVVIRQGSAILELFASEDQSLLVWGNTLLVLDLCLDIFVGIRGLDLKSDGLTREGFDKNLHVDSVYQSVMGKSG